MSEYELTDLTAGAMSNFLTTFTIFVSLVTAFAITAFVAGARLSTVQVFVINACFLLSSSVMGLLSVLIFGVFLRRAKMVAELGSAGVGPIVNFTWFVAGLYILLTIGCLVFMWNVRHPDPHG